MLLPAHREVHLRLFARPDPDVNASDANASVAEALLSALRTLGSATVREHGPDPSRDNLVEFSARLEPTGRVDPAVAALTDGTVLTDPRIVWKHVDGVEADQIPRYAAGDAVRWQGFDTVIGGRAAPPAERPEVGWTYAVKDANGRYTAVREHDLQPTRPDPD
jgi:hypothetical protein